MTIHESHLDIIKRLKRAEGHLKSVIAMLEEARPCVDVAQQLQAVESAVGNAKQALIRDHIDHCIDHAVREGGLTADAALAELKTITKYL
ncbi:MULTISPECIES: metal-sensing transcriptional repressor [unclassified Burkholderia]|uniref:metal-sensing transcriptional repressor n=1 Tax=unclassified Burkholderia TaxID=2613784 RepID=UPI0010FA223F|nr:MULTISPECIES: metal-sensing transcriptional repressor [unclassified Burkholderia]